MKKVLIVVLIGVVGVGGWRWQQRRADHSAARNLAYNRMWVDHMPENERDTFNALVMDWPEGLGASGKQSRWHLDVERFYFDTDGNAIRAVFPWSNDRERVTVHAAACDEHGMDYCLDVTDSKHLVTRYYSRAHWGRKTVDDVATFSAELLATTAK
ncbi:MAG: hypothetical protein ABI591_30200 [Kofleriaceae bacterium]